MKSICNPQASLINPTLNADTEDERSSDEQSYGGHSLRLLLGRALEAYRRLTHAALLNVAHAHDARVHRARNAVVVLAVELREHVDCGTVGDEWCTLF